MDVSYIVVGMDSIGGEGYLKVCIYFRGMEVLRKLK